MRNYRSLHNYKRGSPVAEQASPDGKSNERTPVNRVAVLSVAAAILSAAIAIPGAIYSTNQLVEIRAAAGDAAKNLKAAQDLALTAQEQLKEAHDQTRSAGRIAESTLRMAASNEDAALGVGRLVEQTGKQADATASTVLETRKLAETSQRQLEIEQAARDPELYLQKIEARAPVVGQRIVWIYTLASRNGIVPRDLVITSDETIVRGGEYSYTPKYPNCSNLANDSHYFGKGIFWSTPGKPLTEEMVSALKSDQLKAVFSGRVCYKSQGKPKVFLICGGLFNGQETRDCRPVVPS
jgi:hypothetical protein